MPVSIEKQRKAYARTKGICVVCGKPVSKDESKWSADHFIPRAIYKWVPDEETKKLIESSDNIFVVHPACNEKKDSTLPTNREIDEMHASEQVKNKATKMYKQAESSVIAYRAIKQSVHHSQNGRCATCGRQISLNDATLRRKNSNYDRDKDNAMCLCEACNMKAADPGKKRRMYNSANKNRRKKWEDNI